jgi:hypothetical protein
MVTPADGMFNTRATSLVNANAYAAWVLELVATDTPTWVVTCHAGHNDEAQHCVADPLHVAPPNAGAGLVHVRV